MSGRARGGTLRVAVSAIALLIATPGIVDAARAQDVSALRAPVIEVPVTGATAESVDVYVDTIQVNAFSRFDPGAIVVDFPFEQSKDVFEVAIIDRASGSVLFSSKYRMAAGEFFDTVETDYGFDNSLVWRFKSRQKPPSDGYETTDWAEDFRATGSFTGYRGNWTTSLDGELVGTDDDNNTLRNDGPKLDMSRGVGTIGYADTELFGQAGIGDVTINSFNSLVHGPLSSRGVSFDAGLAGDVVTVAGGNVYGSNIVGFQRGPEAWNEDNRRTSADISVRPLQTADLDVELFGSLFDAVRPAEFGFNIADVPDGEENTVFGGGMRISAFENRLSLQGELARSRYANPTNLNFANEFGNSTDIGATYDNASTLRADAGVWRGETLQVDAYAGYSLIGALYNAVDAFTTADRETWEYGAVFSYDIATLNVDRVVFDNNVDDIANILKTRQRSLSTSLSFNLEEFRQPQPEAPAEGTDAAAEPSGRFLMAVPSSVTISTRDDRVEALNADVVTANSSIAGSEIPNTKAVSMNLGMSWYWSNADTSLNLSRSIFDTRQVGRESADTVDNFVDLSQGFRGDIWSSTTRLAYGQSENKDTATRSTTYRYEAGQSFTLDMPDWPTASVGGDVSLEKTVFIVDGNAALTNTWQANASLEFSKYFPTSWQSVNPSLALTFVINDVDRRDPNFGATSNYEYAFSLVSGLRF